MYPKCRVVFCIGFCIGKDIRDHSASVTIKADRWKVEVKECTLQR